MADACLVCRKQPGKVCRGCLTDMDRQLADLPRRFHALADALRPRQTAATERGATRVHAGLPVHEDALSLIGPGADVPPILHPRLRHWSATRTVQVTTHIVGIARTAQVKVTDWFTEPVTGPDGTPELEQLPDDDQIGVTPPREWLDMHARRLRSFYGHHVPRRTQTRQHTMYVPATYRTLLGLKGGPVTIGMLAAVTIADGGLQRLADRGMLARQAEAEHHENGGEPPRSMRWDVDYLRSWLEKACDDDALDVAEFAAQLRALHAEITRVLGETPDQTWVGRCPAFIAELDADGEPSGRKKPCGAGLWQDNGAHLSAQVRCPRCHSVWDTRGHAGAGTAREIRRVWPYDRRRRYTAAEINQLRKPSCPACGGRVQVRWRDVTGTRDPQRTWQPHGATCERGCPEAGRVV